MRCCDRAIQSEGEPVAHTLISQVNVVVFLKVPLVTLDADVDFVVSESCVASGYSFTF